jgi:hypothetical protein
MRKLVPILALLVGCAAPWPASSIATLSRACEGAGGLANKCDCFTAEVQKRMSHEDFQKWQSQIATGAVPETRFTNIMTEAALACGK